MEERQKIQLPSFKGWVPDKCRFWIYIAFLVAFQFSNGIYFASMGQMAGRLSVTTNDVMMMSHAVLIGLTMYFPVAFRMKSRFTNRTLILSAAIGLMLCNMIIPYLNSVPLMVLVCFVAGFFRLMGTFECFSTILPKLTPTYNYATFLSFVFLVVIGVIKVFDIISAQITYLLDWQYVHHTAIALMVGVIIAAFFLMRPFRFMPKLQLYGIDWLGMLVWSIFILSLIFVAQYGEQMNWLHSPFIRIAIATSCLSLAANLWRMNNIRHPYLEVKAFTANNVVPILLIFLIMDILLSSQNVLQNCFTEAILRYDYLNTISLKWFDFGGILTGAIISCLLLSRKLISHQTVMVCGLSLIVVYVSIMYFIVSPDTNIEKLYLPMLICGCGHVMIFISLTVYAQANVPFKNYFQVLCILGFIRTGLASPLGGAIYSRALTGMMSKNFDLLGSYINPYTLSTSTDVSNAVTAEVIVSSIKEGFGWSVMYGIAVIVLIVVYQYRRTILFSR